MFADVVTKLQALVMPLNIVRFRVDMIFRFLA